MDNEKLKELFDDLWDGTGLPRKGQKSVQRLTGKEWYDLIEEWQKAGFLPPPSPTPSKDTDLDLFICCFRKEVNNEILHESDALETEIDPFHEIGPSYSDWIKEKRKKNGHQ